MLSSSSFYASKIFPRFLGTASRSPSLRWSSSSLDRHDFLYPPSSTNPASRPSPSEHTAPPSSFSSSPQAAYQALRPQRGKTFIHAYHGPKFPRDLILTGKVTSLALLQFLRELKRNPSSPPAPSAEIREVLDGQRCIYVDESREEAEELLWLLMEPAKSLEEGVEIAQWILRVTELGRGAVNSQMLVYLTIHELVGGLTSRIHPPPPPDPIIQFLLSNARRIFVFGVFPKKSNPLVALLEMYSLYYRQDLDRVSPSSSEPPTPASRLKANSLRVRYLAVVRSIHQAMREVEKDVTTIRGSNALMISYNRAEEYEEGEKIWRAMRSNGGVGIDQRSVTVYLNGCGYSGNLPRALSTWKELHATATNLSDDNYKAYQDCLNRMGAWDELLDFFANQVHNPIGEDPLPIDPRAVASALVSALRLVNNPHLRTLHAPDADAYYRLESGLQELVGEETWNEVGRLLKTGEYWRPPVSSHEDLADELGAPNESKEEIDHGVSP